jgi:hypothetical protein
MQADRQVVLVDAPQVSNTSSACARVFTNTIEVLCWRMML